MVSSFVRSDTVERKEEENKSIKMMMIGGVVIVVERGRLKRHKMLVVEMALWMWKGDQCPLFPSIVVLSST
jgi:hypothetical protein